jgi:hypothetical protein
VEKFPAKSSYTHLPRVEVSTISYKDVNNSNDEYFLDNISFYVKKIFEDINETNLSTSNKEDILQEKIIIGSTKLDNKKIHIRSIRWNKNYSKLITKEFKILNYDTKKYSNTHNLITIDLESKYGNLYDFNIHSKDIVKQSLHIIPTTWPYVKAKYKAIVSKNLKYFKFNYFDIEKSTFQYKSLPIWIQHETVSTQTDINPSTSNFKLLKIIFISTVILFFIFLFIFYKRYIYLIAMGIFIYILVRMIMPLDSIVLKENTKIKILPIEKSTVFYITREEIKAKVIKYQNNFVKIIFNNKIGWINENVLSK